MIFHKPELQLAIDSSAIKNRLAAVFI